MSLDLGSHLQKKRLYFKIDDEIGKINTAVFSPPQHESEGAQEWQEAKLLLDVNSELSVLLYHG